MKIKFKYVLLVLVGLLFVGCSIVGNHTYTPPSPRKMHSNSVIINKSKNEIWKHLISGLANNFFVINNMDKESGFINLSYSGDPEKYIDAGSIYSMVENLAGKREYRFSGAKKFQRYEFVEKGNLFFIERTISLEGRINVIINEIEENRTSVTVNTKYIISQTSVVWDVLRNQKRIVQTFSFNTGGYDTNSGGTKFQANGKLEQEIIDILNEEFNK